MDEHPFHVVDVFTTERFAGNQLAVFGAAATLSDDEMLALTRETNFSEATFVESTDPDGGGYDVRIFDPAGELDFAGHPTLGTAAVLREFVLEDPPDPIVLDLPVGSVPVRVEGRADGDRYWMRQVPPTFDRRVDASLAASALGLPDDALDADLPVQVVSTGLPTAVVPLRSLDAIRSIAVDPGAYERFVDAVGEVNLLCFTTGTVHDRHDAHVRVFADYAGVPEDPATGSSNGCLAAYLVEHGVAGAGGVDWTVEQGYEVGRPSHLHLRARQAGDGDEEGIEVDVGGGVVPVASGHLLP